MAELYVKDSLNSQKCVRFNVSLVEYVLTGTEGDSKWTLEIGTTYPSASGTVIPPKIIHPVSEANIDKEIQAAVSDMCSYIDWTVLEDDNDPPILLSALPVGQDIRIRSQVEVIVKDNLPSSGIDLSEMRVVLNNGVQDFDITNDVVVLGNPFKYWISWKPDQVVYKRYDSI